MAGTRHLKKYIIMINSMTETLQHGNTVTDTENVLQTVFVYISEKSKKLSAIFKQFLFMAMKKLSATFGCFFACSTAHRHDSFPLFDRNPPF